MKNKPKSFLIINPFGIGDVLFSLPLIKSLKENFPDSKLFYLCNQRAYPLLENNSLITKVFIYERDEFEAIKKISKFSWIKKILGFVSQIKKEKIDVTIDLSLNSQFGFFSWLAGIRARIGYDYKNRGRFLTKKISFPGYQKKHVIEYYLELLKLIGVSPEYRKTELILDRDQKNRARVFLKEQSLDEDGLLVTITPCGGASWGRDSYRKHWPAKRFAELADRLIDECKVKVILAGSDQEKAVIDDIEKSMVNKPIKAAGLPLRDFLALLGESTLLVANDGGPIHMGAFLGIKTVSIFGPVNEVVYGPYPPDPQKHRVVKKDLACRPCYQQFRLPECSDDLKCLKSITVDEVLEAACSLLDCK